MSLVGTSGLNAECHRQGGEAGGTYLGFFEEDNFSFGHFMVFCNDKNCKI